MNKIVGVIEKRKLWRVCASNREGAFDWLFLAHFRWSRAFHKNLKYWSWKMLSLNDFRFDLLSKEFIKKYLCGLFCYISARLWRASMRAIFKRCVSAQLTPDCHVAHFSACRLHSRRVGYVEEGGREVQLSKALITFLNSVHVSRVAEGASMLAVY